MENHEINKRIKQVIDYKVDGNVRKFAEIINIRQQTVNRLFNVDTRTDKYPLATTEIVIAITEMCVDISPFWLLTGKGEMLNGDKKESVSVKETDKSIIYSIDKISALERELGRKEAEVDFLKMRIKELESGSSYSKASGFRSVPSVDTSNPSQTREKAK